MLPRTGSHSRCTAKYSPQVVLFHRESGARGELARQMLAEFKNRKMPFLWEECRGRNTTLDLPPMISPLPPSPKLNNTKRKSGTHIFSPENKRQKVIPEEVAEECEWEHDPVNIEILEPSEEAYVETEEFDSMTKNIFFPSPISTLTTDSEFSPVQLKSVCLRVDPKTQNKESKKEEAEQKTKSDKQQSEEKVKQNKRQDSEVKVKQNKTQQSEEKVKQNKRQDSEVKVKQNKTQESEEKVKQNKTQESEEKVKQNKTQDNEVEVKQNKTQESEEKVKQNKGQEKEEKVTQSENMKCVEKTKQCQKLDSETLTKQNEKLEEGKPKQSGRVEKENLKENENSAENNVEVIDFCFKEPTAEVNMPFNDNIYNTLMRQHLQLRHSEATPTGEMATDPQTDEQLEALIHKTFNQYQRVQEERVVLNIGGQCFSTSRVTLGADPSSLFGLLLRKNCPMRPHRNTYFFDRDRSHFKLILNYLRNGAHLDICLLPHEKRYLLELLMETRFYYLAGLEKLVLDKLFKVTGRRDF